MRSKQVIRTIRNIIQLTKADAVGIPFAILIPAIFALSYIRSYAPLTEGWWHVIATWMLEGKVPYRDFELLVPPLYPSLIAIGQFLGIENFLALRYVGVILLVLITICVYLLLRPFVRGLVLGLITATVMVYLQMGAAFISYDYVYVAIFFLLLTFIPAVVLLSNNEKLSDKSVFIASALSGAFAVLSFLTKQTNGLVSLFFGLVVAVYLASRVVQGEKKIRLTKLVRFGMAPFALGAAIVSGGFVIILILTGSLIPAISDLSSSASDTKGGLVHSLFSWSQGFFAFDAVTSAIRLVLPPITFIALITLISQQCSEFFPERIARWIPQKSLRALGYWSFTVAFAAGSAALGLKYRIEIAQYLSQIVFLPIILVSLITVIVVFFGKANPAFLPISFASLALIWASGMSAGLGETAMFLGVGQAAVLLLGKTSPKFLAIGLTILISISTISTGWLTKSSSPFNWWGLSTPSTSQALVEIPQGLQQGLFASPEIAEAIVGVNTALDQISACPGEIVEFPHVPLFILNQDEVPAGRLATYWLDFSSSQEISNEISRIGNSEIKGLVLVQMPNFVWDGHEQLFAGGRQLEHEVLYNTLLKRSEDMSVQGEWAIGKDYSISVYTKPCE